MDLQQRINLLVQLGQYLSSNNTDFIEAKAKAAHDNAWFNPVFIDTAIENICTNFLQKDKLVAWASEYQIANTVAVQKNVGVVMAGNIPLVGFHDFLCVFISGHIQTIKVSSKDQVLIKHIVQKMYQWEVTIQNHISFAEQLKNCDAYIATGSNNSGRYFDYYFGKYPNIIRKNKTSVAILLGNETAEQLERLSDDILMYYGLGCRNVTKLYVPENYNFLPLLDALKKYDYFFEHHKYKHNYDYQLAILMMGNQFYMTNETVVFAENKALFSPVAQVNYQFYTNVEETVEQLKTVEELQCIVGQHFIPFGRAQSPELNNYADGIDTLAFLTKL